MKKESKPGTLKQEEATDKVAIRAKKEEGLVLSCIEAKNSPETGKDCKATQNRRKPLHCLRNILASCLSLTVPRRGSDMSGSDGYA